MVIHSPNTLTVVTHFISSSSSLLAMSSNLALLGDIPRGETSVDGHDAGVVNRPCRCRLRRS